MLSNDAPHPVRTNAPDESSNNNSNSTIQRTALYKQFTSYLARPNVVASGGGSSLGQKRTLSSYAVHDDPRQTKDEWQIPTLEEFEFFEKVGRFVSLESLSLVLVVLQMSFAYHPLFILKGREFQSKKQKHHFTTEEKDVMATYESAALRPSHTAVYRHWLSRLPPRSYTSIYIAFKLTKLTLG
jgi:hypothetical protein